MRSSPALSAPILCLAALVGALGNPSPAMSADGVPTFATERTRALEAGEVLFEQLEPSGGSGVAVRAAGLIDASPARVWPVLRDCERYREFLPGVEESELKGRENGVAVCETKIDLPFPLGDLRSKMRVAETEIDGGFKRSWTLIEGNYDRNQGSWTLVPWPGSGDRTLAVYQLDMKPKTIVPDFLLRRAQAGTVPKVFEAVRRRVRERGGR